MAALAAVSLAYVAGGAAPAQAAAPQCAATTDPDAPATPAPGDPCWAEVQPYPFGFDGLPVDLSPGARCAPKQPFGPNYSDYLPLSDCFLEVDSFAFRAWNRGLAVTSLPFDTAGNRGAPAFPVWKFNGTRWFPDPTFPGAATCGGDTILWAGKLDYWLIGDRKLGTPAPTWPRVCRFDGANNVWQPLDVPVEATRFTPPASAGSSSLKPGAIQAGACFAWNDCWFFGDWGAVVRWDGQTLKDASPDAASDRSLAISYRAAVRDAAGKKLAAVVGTSGGPLVGEQLPPRRDGTPPAQLFGSTGGAFAPLAFSPPTFPRPDDPYRTDLIAVDVDGAGHGWVAGNPVGTQAGSGNPPGRGSFNDAEPSPVAPISVGGTPTGCSAPAPDRFTWGARFNLDRYLWSSLAVFPGTGAALAGGAFDPADTGTWINADAREPILTTVACDGAVTETRFRVRDATEADQAHAHLVPANRLGFITSVAINAANDAWAATSVGELRHPDDQAPAQHVQRPKLYRLTDGTPPAAPAGDDDESRPPVFQLDPPIFVDVPPEPEPPVPAPVTTTQPAKPKTRHVKQKAPIYSIRTRKGKPTKEGTLTLYVSFKVRRPVSIGIQALRGKKVVASSGIKRFKGKRGTLKLVLHRERWPTRVRFYQHKTGKKSSSPPMAVPQLP